MSVATNPIRRFIRVRPWQALPRQLGAWLAVTLAFQVAGADAPTSRLGSVDFNRDIRPLLSENCYKCHGPDDGARKAKLRFDVRNEALKPAKSGQVAIVPGSPDKSELMARVTASDPDDRMPPPKTGKTLSAAQIDLLRRWIAQGAPYATHWAYARPVRPPLPEVRNRRWARNPIDQFILARLESEGLRPSPEADRYTLIRRVSLDLTGLPPTPEEVDRFLRDSHPEAYEHLVDRLLTQTSFGEHWAGMWLDLARYADSAGYADDPLRTIWGYRDYVIRAFNSNKPFDRFTIEQIAGDLLPDANEEDRIATAFHRNTMTNNEGGTDDEEFRNAAIVDRVNTTMAVWMATSIACAQCHNHKYDPISQQDYFRFFAILNNTEDADRSDEAPVLEFFTPAQKRQRGQLQEEIHQIQTTFRTPTPNSFAHQAQWEQGFPKQVAWQAVEPSEARTKAGAPVSTTAQGSAQLGPIRHPESYSFEFPLAARRFTGLRLEAFTAGSNSPVASPPWILSRLEASVLPANPAPLRGRYVRVELPGKSRILSLAEVQVFQGQQNLALNAEASQSSTAYDGPARLAIDGSTDGDFDKAHSTTHTEESQDPWWEADLKAVQSVERVVIWNRTDNGLQTRLKNFRIRLLDENHSPVWERFVTESPNPSLDLQVDGTRQIPFDLTVGEGTAAGFSPASLVGNSGADKKGWAPAGDASEAARLTLVTTQRLDVLPNSRLRVTLELMPSERTNASAGLRFALCEDQGLEQVAQTPDSVRTILARPAAQRTATQAETLTEYYRANLEPDLQSERERLARLEKELEILKPSTVPVMRELVGDKRRKTHIQFRGNFLALGDEVSPAVPAVFHPLPKDVPPDRLALARWLVAPDNPLTARVIANRFWEQIFGFGIVRTCEEFGSQGELPNHPRLLDWLATELVAHGWDVKAFLRLLVTSAAYRQSSRVTPQLQERDPDNILLARGPRQRMPAEEVRDQALAVSGLLSHKMYGPSVRPPRPSSGLTAAFGGSLDWKTSEGEDRYRRALYIEWRRTSPYPSMATFDAPNREVCTLRRPRSNTPLQALVTLNDAVYVEAAQALARRIAAQPGSIEEKARFGFQLCLVRPPRSLELRRLLNLYHQALAHYAGEAEQAKAMATDPLGPAPQGSNLLELAAWTVVGNVLLNLDEMLMRP